MSPHLLSPSESRAFNGFLASVDRHAHDSVEWLGYSPALADKIPHKQGKEALARATKELLSFGAANAPLSSRAPNVAGGSGSTSISGGTSATASTAGASSSGSGASHWPSFAHEASPTHDASRSSSSTRYDRHSPYSFSSYRPQQHGQPASSVFTLPPLNVPSRPHPVSSSVSAPSVLLPTSKRALSPDHDPDGSTSSGASSKRARPSPPVTTSSTSADLTTLAPAKARRTSQSMKRVAGPTSSSKPALLSPSQKRANHIQSEQKRRANIRRGYEVLCEAVPALREAIRLEEEANAAAADAAVAEDKGRKRKRRGEDDKSDGRAGPRSENVVLSKTIEYIRSLLSDRQGLVGRLTYARSTLARGHPALTVAPGHADQQGVPLWDREWKGGQGAVDEDEGDGGGSDEEEQ